MKLHAFYKTLYRLIEKVEYQYSESFNATFLDPQVSKHLITNLASTIHPIQSNPNQSIKGSLSSTLQNPPSPPLPSRNPTTGLPPHPPKHPHPHNS